MKRQVTFISLIFLLKCFPKSTTIEDDDKCDNNNNDNDSKMTDHEHNNSKW